MPFISWIVFGIVGTFFGGWLFTTFGMSGVTGLNTYSMVVAVIGAILVLLIYHMVVRRRATLKIPSAVQSILAGLTSSSSQ